MTASEAKAYLDRIPEDEPVFVLRAQDVLSMLTIREWLRMAERFEVRERKIAGAEDDLQQFREWRHSHSSRVKLPD